MKKVNNYCLYNKMLVRESDIKHSKSKLSFYSPKIMRFLKSKEIKKT